jgi:hypothetical protein
LKSTLENLAENEKSGSERKELESSLLRNDSRTIENATLNETVNDDSADFKNRADMSSSETLLGRPPNIAA